MLIIDSHAHIFRTVKGKNTNSLKFGKVKHNNKVVRLLPPLATKTTFTSDVLLEYMDLAKVNKAVLLQAPFYGEMNHYIKEVINKYPDKFTGAAYIDLWEKDSIKSFYHIIEILKFKVIKIEFSSKTGFSSFYPGIKINDKKLDWFWTECEKRNIIVILDLGAVGAPSYQTKNIKSILHDNPDIKIIISHLAQPPLNEENNINKIKLWKEQLLLAKNPGIYFDLAVLPSCISYEDYPYPKTRNFIYEALKNVGADKMIWGSDIPGLFNYVTYSKYIKFFQKYCNFSKNDLDKIMGKNAFELFFKNRNSDCVK